LVGGNAAGAGGNKKPDTLERNLASEEGDEKVILLHFLGPSLYNITYIGTVWFYFFLENYKNFLTLNTQKMGFLCGFLF
jgi:hypothetical protein